MKPYVLPGGPGRQPAPLRKIKSRLNIDGYIIDLLECGHHVPVDEGSGHQRRRCESCKLAAIQKRRRDGGKR